MKAIILLIVGIAMIAYGMTFDYVPFDTMSANCQLCTGGAMTIICAILVAIIEYPLKKK